MTRRLLEYHQRPSFQYNIEIRSSFHTLNIANFLEQPTILDDLHRPGK